MRFFILVSIFITTSASASKLVKRNKDLSYFEGTWKCEGSYSYQNKDKVLKEDFNGEKVTFKPILGGNWLQGDYVDKRSRTNRCLYAVDGDIFRLQCFGEYEGTIFSTSKGWNNKVLKFTGQSYFHSYVSKETKEFTRVSDNEYKVISTIDNDKANYHTKWNATCKK